ncbi:MAG TPA: hypothetical protein VJ123_00770, partial [Anaerolineales bacterium]|nr:hypothetical protein [Anaerolineales bacterium]
NKANDHACEKVSVGVGESNLAIWKSGPAECTRKQTCVYEIKIVNVGQGPYQGPIVIEERNFQHAGLVLDAASTTMTGCKDTTLGKIECDLGTVTLNPQQSVTGKIGVTLPADLPPALDKIKDCVKITKSVGTVSKPESCAETPLQAEFDLKPVKTGPAKCAEPDTCYFFISVWNEGTADYEGPISITETSPYPDLKLGSFKPSPPWNCSESPAGKAAWPVHQVTCTHPWVKLPGAATIFGKIGVVGPLTLQLGLGDTTLTKFENCAKVGYKGGKPDANPGNDEVCITTPLVPSGGTLTGGAGPHWEISLTGIGTLSCLIGPCTDYDFTISNAGPSTYSLPMTLRIKLPEGAKLKSAQGTQSGKSCAATGWSCGQSGEEVVCRPSDCSLGKDDKTAVHFDLRLLAEGAPPPPEGTTKTVCGELEWFAPPSKEIDIEQQQTAGLKYSRACVTTKILVGKSDLALTKSGPAECSPGGKCAYSLTVRNTSQAPFSGQIKFTDTLPSGWKLSSSGKAKCTQKGDTVACEHPTLTLQPNWTETIRLEVQIPAKEKKAEVENCASLDYAKGAGDANAANDKSCVKTKLKKRVEPAPAPKPAPEPEPTPKPEKAAPRPQCDQGWREVSSIKAKTLSKQGWEIKIVTSGGQSILCARKPSPPPPALRPQCDQGWREVSSSKAKTLSKQGWEIKTVTSGGQSILCAKAPSLPAPLSPAEECQQKGWVWDGAQCLSPADICQQKGWVWDRRHQRCVPPLSPAEECQQKGWVWDGNRCLSPELACKMKGWVWDGNRCLRIEPKVIPLPETPKAVPPPETPKFTPQLIPGPLQIICPEGTVWSDAYKKCMPRID